MKAKSLRKRIKNIFLKQFTKKYVYYDNIDPNQG